MSVSIIYPHPELPLIPKMILPLVGDLVIEVDGAGPLKVSEISDMERNSNSLSDHQKNQIAKEVVRKLRWVLSAQKCESKVKAIRLDLPLSIRLIDLHLMDRAKVSLQGNRLFDNLPGNKNWRTASLYELSSEHGIGTSTLLALLVAADVFHDLGPKEEVPQAPVMHEARFVDDELHAAILGVLHSSRTVDVFITVSGWLGEPNRGIEVAAQRYGVSEERVRQIYRGACDTLRRSGAGAQRFTKLKQCLQHINEMCPATPQKVLEEIRAQGFYSDRVLSSDINLIELTIEAANMFGLECRLKRMAPDCSVEPHGVELLVLQHQEPIIRSIVHEARQLQKSHGLIPMGALWHNWRQRYMNDTALFGHVMKEHPWYRSREQFFSSRMFWTSLKTIAGLVWLDREPLSLDHPNFKRQIPGWAFLLPGAGVHRMTGVIAHILKLTYHFRRLHVRDIEASLTKRSSVFSRLVIPRFVLKRLCEYAGVHVIEDPASPQAQPTFRLENPMKEGAGFLDQSDEGFCIQMNDALEQRNLDSLSSPAEQMIFDLLKDQPQGLSTSEVVKKLSSQEVPAITLSSRLKQSPLFVFNEKSKKHRLLTAISEDAALAAA